MRPEPQGTHPVSPGVGTREEGHPVHTPAPMPAVRGGTHGVQTEELLFAAVPAGHRSQPVAAELAWEPAPARHTRRRGRREGTDKKNGFRQLEVEVVAPYKTKKAWMAKRARQQHVRPVTCQHSGSWAAKWCGEPLPVQPPTHEEMVVEVWGQPTRGQR